MDGEILDRVGTAYRDVAKPVAQRLSQTSSTFYLLRLLSRRSRVPRGEVPVGFAAKKERAGLSRPARLPVDLESSTDRSSVKKHDDQNAHRGQHRVATQKKGTNLLGYNINSMGLQDGS